jgi:hypothetical protein
MRIIEEIRQNPRVRKIEAAPMLGVSNLWAGLIMGPKRLLQVVMSLDAELDGTLWEHVSVGIAGDMKHTPTWEEMDCVKRIFWDDEEEVHQIHPKASEHFHGFKETRGILHLWKPDGGWKV